MVSALTIPVAAQDTTRRHLEHSSVIDTARVVSGGDVLVEVSGPATLDREEPRRPAEWKDVSAAFKPAAQSLAPSAVEGKRLSGS